jgi:hypothetical protein
LGDDGDLQIGIAWPTPRFIDNSDGTVTDNLTCLMWTKNCQQISGRFVYAQALSACNDFIFAGYDDWRLPNLLELRSLVDYGRFNPALPEGSPFIFDWTPSFFWTSTTTSYNTEHVRTINMQLGSEFVENKYNTDPSTGLYIWPVRGGEKQSKKDK